MPFFENAQNFKIHGGTFTDLSRQTTNNFNGAQTTNNYNAPQTTHNYNAPSTTNNYNGPQTTNITNKNAPSYSSTYNQNAPHHYTTKTHIDNSFHQTGDHNSTSFGSNHSQGPPNMGWNGTSTSGGSSSMSPPDIDPQELQQFQAWKQQMAANQHQRSASADPAFPPSTHPYHQPGWVNAPHPTHLAPPQDIPRPRSQPTHPGVPDWCGKSYPGQGAVENMVHRFDQSTRLAPPNQGGPSHSTPNLQAHNRSNTVPAVSVSEAPAPHGLPTPAPSVESSQPPYIAPQPMRPSSSGQNEQLMASRNSFNSSPNSIHTTGTNIGFPEPTLPAKNHPAPQQQLPTPPGSQIISPPMSPQSAPLATSGFPAQNPVPLSASVSSQMSHSTAASAPPAVASTGAANATNKGSVPNGPTPSTVPAPGGVQELVPGLVVLHPPPAVAGGEEAETENSKNKKKGGALKKIARKIGLSKSKKGTGTDVH